MSGRSSSSPFLPLPRGEKQNRESPGAHGTCSPRAEVGYTSDGEIARSALWMLTMAYGGARLLVPWGFDGYCIRWERRCCWAMWLGGTYICWALSSSWQSVVGWWVGGYCALPESVRVRSWGGPHSTCWVRGHLLEIWAGPRAGISAEGYCLCVSGPTVCWPPGAHSPAGEVLALAILLALPSGWALGCPWDMPT